MSDAYLLFTLQPYTLMVEATRVLEVLDGLPEKASAGGETHCLWRDAPLRVVDGRARLGLPRQGAPMLLVIGDDGHSEGLSVDRVLGLRRVDDDALKPLPPLPETLEGLFDRIWPQPDGSLILRCRHSWQHP